MTMDYAQHDEKDWRLLVPGQPVHHGEIVTSYEAITSWSENERASWGIEVVGLGDSPPPGQRIASTSLGSRDGHPVWVNVFEMIDPVVDPVDPYANYIPTPLFRQRAEAIGVWEDLATFLVQSPPMLLKVLTLERGIDPADDDLNAGFDTMKIPPLVRSFLLADPALGVPTIPEGVADG